MVRRTAKKLILFYPSVKIIQRNKSPGTDGQWVQKSMIHGKNYLFAFNDTHKTWDVRDMTQCNRLARIHRHVLALRGTCRVGKLNVIIAILGLPNGILPLLIYKGRDVSIGLLGTFE